MLLFSCAWVSKRGGIGVLVAVDVGSMVGVELGVILGVLLGVMLGVRVSVGVAVAVGLGDSKPEKNEQPADTNRRTAVMPIIIRRGVKLILGGGFMFDLSSHAGRAIFGCANPLSITAKLA
jgi:hypothetical protein